MLSAFITILIALKATGLQLHADMSNLTAHFSEYDDDHDFHYNRFRNLPTTPADVFLDASTKCRVHFDRLVPELHSKEQETSRQEFLSALGSKHPAETLLVNRYRYAKNKTLPLPYALKLFDWLIIKNPASQEQVDHPNPRSVFCDAKLLDRCVELSKSLSPLGKKQIRVLAIANHDQPWLSAKCRMKFVVALRDCGKFSKVLFESKDIRMDGIGSLPQGLNTEYIEDIYGPQQLLHEIRDASFDKKEHSVLAAWGAVWSDLDATLESRIQATSFTNTSCIAPRQSLNPDIYLSELAKYRFALAPTGQSIFTPKMMEALLVLTIPIAQRVPDGGAWEELRDTYGWPMVIVDRWEEITSANLTRWWAELAPKLQAGRMQLLADSWFKTVMS